MDSYIFKVKMKVVKKKLPPAVQKKADETNSKDYEYGTWILKVRPFGTITKLTEHDTRILDKPKRLFTDLLPHQQTTVKAMLDLENRRFINVQSLVMSNWSGKFEHKHLSDPVIETTAGVLSEKLGSGKSFEIMALISLNPIPRQVAEITSFPFVGDIDNRYSYVNLQSSYQQYYTDDGFGLEVRRTYKTIFRQTVIFVGKSVLGQWTQYINDYTDFKVLVINDVRNMRKLHQMVFGPQKGTESRAELKKYDIILVKNKIISGEFEIPEIVGTGLENTKTKPILTIFGEMFRNIAFARVVLDDFDTINIPATSRVVPALFTWFISATTKSAPPRSVVGRTYHDIRDIVTYHRTAYVENWKNPDLFNYFNVCNVDDFINKSTNVGKVSYYSYKFINPNEQYISALGAMGAEDANAVMEMLNGDAVNTAAEAAGIKSTSVADIFEKILDTKWVKYKKHLEIAEYIPQVREVIEELPEYNAEEEYDDDEGKPKRATQTSLGKLTSNINAAGPLSQVDSIIHYHEESVDKHIDSVESENTRLKNESGTAIERVKDNLKSGECPICCESLASVEGIMIMKCCGVTLCTTCVTGALKLHNTGNNVAGMCPNCRRQCGFKDIVMIDKDIDLNRIIEDKIADKAPPPPPPVEFAPDDANAEPAEPEEELTKFSCIVGLLKGKKYEELRKQQNIQINGILKGSSDLPEPKEIKALVFANFNETLDNLQKKLDQHKLTYLRLHGTPNQINDIVRRYKLSKDHPEAVDVLLINAAEYCAGLNLQNTTDLIFTHKVLDRNVEAQIVGRAVRIGRITNLRVHYVLYHNEFGHLSL